MANIGEALSMFNRGIQGNTEGSRRTMTKKQKEILTGMVLGDCYIQKTGKKNARIRMEH